jgi:Arc/MetJ-type ribon-helix-helix transcriptional regulator
MDVHCLIPAPLIERIDRTVDGGRFLSRSEAIRHLVSAGLDVIERDASRRGVGR